MYNYLRHQLKSQLLDHLLIRTCHADVSHIVYGGSELEMMRFGLNPISSLAEFQGS